MPSVTAELLCGQWALHLSHPHSPLESGLHSINAVIMPTVTTNRGLAVDSPFVTATQPLLTVGTENCTAPSTDLLRPEPHFDAAPSLPHLLRYTTRVHVCASIQYLFNIHLIPI